MILDNNVPVHLANQSETFGAFELGTHLHEFRLDKQASVSHTATLHNLSFLLLIY